jgi:endonuclease IV
MLRALDFGKTAENFGGYSALARRLTEFQGIPVALSTCHGWARRDKVPPWRAVHIAELAKAENIKLVYKKKKKKRKAKPRAS